MAEWVTGEVQKIHFLTERLFTITVHAPVFSFFAGQFTKIRLKIHNEYIQRAYSYVNAPNKKDLEFYLAIVNNGKLSPNLAKLQPGDKIQIVKKALGFFILKEIPNFEVLWMFATGTALGPYLSILEFGEDTERFRKIILVHAVRYKTDLSYFSRMLELQKYYAGKLIIQTILSQEVILGSLTGRIPELIKNGELEKKVGLSLNKDTSHVMLCGNPQMIRDTQSLLIKTRGMTKNLRSKPGNITYEHYW